MTDVGPREVEPLGLDHRGAEFAIDIDVNAHADGAGFVAWVVVRRGPNKQVVAHEEVRAGAQPWGSADQALAAAYARGRRLVFRELIRSAPSIASD